MGHGHYNEDGYYIFAQVTSTDKAGLLWVATILSLLFSSITLAVRYHLKRRTFGIDDWLISAATVAALAQYISLFIAMDDYGLGKSSSLLSTNEATLAGRCVFASNCFFIIGLALSKFSVVFFLKRLFTRDFRAAWLVCNILVGVVAVWVIASILILTIGCGPSSKLVGDRCSGQVLRWSIVAALDTFFELAIIVLSVVLVWPLQMSLDIKLTVVFAFFFRIFVAVFAGIHAARIADYVKSDDAGLSIIDNLVWQNIELGYALIAATIPTLKSFIRGYEKAMGWEVSYNTKSNSGVPGMFGSVAMPMQSFHSKQSMSASRDRDRQDNSGYAADECDGVRPNLRPDGHNYNAKAYGPRQGESAHKLKRAPSTSSSESQNPIIRKDIHFTISSESAPPQPWSGIR